MHLWAGVRRREYAGKRSRALVGADGRSLGVRWMLHGTALNCSSPPVDALMHIRARRGVQD